MKTSMLEYYKIVLRKVSFHPQLFRKEYRKALFYLTEDESLELKLWLRGNLAYIPT
ncbi:MULTISPECIES: hypothetical protein [Fulvivirga]|uniref:hypothetical protein n=1 Tax=Fulvivirga TaxID=396811 RepID=UPI0016236E2C|nr:MULTISPECIES: hypothetical protein [Fulvivirga]UII33590.1 hypothetical protein LVD17_07130 [Fulvivirga ulvae]